VASSPLPVWDIDLDELKDDQTAAFTT